MTTITRPLETTHPTLECPTWCTADHVEQARESANSKFASDRLPIHHRQLAEGVETADHGPLYIVVLERTYAGTRLYAGLESIDLTADQAEVLGLALIRGANLLRTCGDAIGEIVLEDYWDGKSWVHFGPAVVAPTPAEAALEQP